MSEPRANVSQKHPRVFISYSHDSVDYSARILGFAVALRNNGIDVELDQFHQDKILDWPRWCNEQTSHEYSDFVLCVCTAEYFRRIEGKVPPGKGKGVYWEGNLLDDEIYDAKGNRRIIPILLGDEPDISIPRFLRGWTFCRLRTFDLNDIGYEQLLRILTMQVRIEKNPLGPIPVLPGQSLPPANSSGDAAERHRRVEVVDTHREGYSSLSLSLVNEQKRPDENSLGIKAFGTNVLKAVENPPSGALQLPSENNDLTPSDESEFEPFEKISQNILPSIGLLLEPSDKCFIHLGCAWRYRERAIICSPHIGRRVENRLKDGGIICLQWCHPGQTKPSRENRRIQVIHASTYGRLWWLKINPTGSLPAPLAFLGPGRNYASQTFGALGVGGEAVDRSRTYGLRVCVDKWEESGSLQVLPHSLGGILELCQGSPIWNRLGEVVGYIDETLSEKLCARRVSSVA